LKGLCNIKFYKKKLDGVMILYDRMGNGVEADGCGVLPGIAQKNGLSKIIKPVSLSSQV
jgi:hypothetical protein